MRATSRSISRNHSRYAGLIESEDNDWLTLIRIQAPRGQPMHLVIQPFDKSQITSVKRLDAGSGRRWPGGSRSSATARRSKPPAWRPSGSNRGGRREQLSALPQQVVHSGQHGRRPEHSPHGRPRGADLRRLSPDRAAAKRVLAASAAGRAGFDGRVPGAADQLGLKTKIENPACFLEDQNVVAVGSDLARLAAVTSQISDG